MRNNEETRFHSRNFYQGKYDFRALIQSEPGLIDHIIRKTNGDPFIDFSNPHAVQALNKACLRLYCGINEWKVNDDFLCPGIPGRADYIHHLADLIESEQSSTADDQSIRILDIGTGGNAIYALLAASLYKWKVVASEVNPQAIDHAQSIVSQNNNLCEQIEIRRQMDSNSIFNGIIQTNEYFHATVCNPPFYANDELAHTANEKKQSAQRLRSLPHSDGKRTFQGTTSELHYPGGEVAFIRKMIDESKQYATLVKYFTTLVSRSGTLKQLEPILKKQSNCKHQIIPMQHGNKRTRILVWSYQVRNDLR